MSQRTVVSGDGSGQDLVALASEWVQAALVHEGAGAKTHAGYDRFRLDKLTNRPHPRRGGVARVTAPQQ